ncbi:MAG: YqaA family protein [Minisyncoccia bacterium]
MSLHYKMLAWFENETDKKYVIYLLGVIAFFESVIFPIPVDVFTFTLSALHPKKWLHYATVATITSVMGAGFGYFLGAYLFDSFGMQMIEFYGYQEQFLWVTKQFNSNIFLVMFLSAFTPIPYKVFTIAGGALRVALLPFFVASVLGRGLRFYGESYLAHRFGKTVTAHIMKKINLYSLLVVVCLVGYFVMHSL